MCNGYAALNISATESNVENTSSENSGYDSRNITTVNSYGAQTNNESANTDHLGIRVSQRNIFNKSKTLLSKLTLLNCNSLVKYLRLMKHDLFAFQETHVTNLISYSTNFMLSHNLLPYLDRAILSKITHPNNFYTPFYVLILSAPASSNPERRQFFDTDGFHDVMQRDDYVDLPAFRRNNNTLTAIDYIFVGTSFSSRIGDVGIDRLRPGLWRANPILNQIPDFRCQLHSHLEKSLSTIVKSEFKRFRTRTLKDLRRRRNCFLRNKPPLAIRLQLLPELTDIAAFKAGVRWREKGEKSAKYLKQVKAYFDSLVPPPQISKDDKEGLLVDITLGEVLFQFARIMSKFGSHGADSLGYPFLHLLFKFQPLQSLVLQVYNEALSKGVFPGSWNDIRVRLLPKKGDLSLLKNWRPISLINSSVKQLPSIGLFLDQEKATIEYTLEFFGFPQTLINILCDPLSLLLFNFALQGLLHHITQDSSIIGNEIYSSPEALRALAYADDVCVLLQSFNNLDRVQIHLSNYGPHDNSSSELLRYLGLSLIQSLAQHRCFEDYLLQMVRIQCTIHSQRRLSLRGRVTVINTLVLSKT
ncbi:hypothetical protein BCV72DRAFT_251174 [Rhizopus microsporus var. microsporus]|uniref:Reverse transcriptase domain-containing protein n=1 Tax=Rhizopus microsporus var. microsporus TaxID=86635 RepID=A0A1X0QXM7_RHIZD|nr:hypothetical protein BCV72DRAFT_251174 [Rhizopus microsporus var. microsporus]